MPWADALARGLVEEGEWATVDEAIAWGRARCDRVLVYLAHDINSASAETLKRSRAV